MPQAPATWTVRSPAHADGPSVHVAVDDAGVATITLDDVAKKNAMTEALGDALQRAVADIRQREDVRAAVLTGQGTAFSAGGDLAMLERLRQLSFADARAHMLSFYNRYLAILDLEVPIVAAVRGPAIGAGLCVACACDIVIVDVESTLAFNFTGLGLHPGMGATALVPRLVGHQRGAELLYTGRRFKGAEAVSMGLALEGVGADDVLPRAHTLATQMAQQAPIAVRELKTRLRIDRDTLDNALLAEASAQARSYASDDLGEGLAALRERRTPKFTGQ